MNQTVVTASTGRELGSRPARRLRAEGQLPGVIYGRDQDPIAVTVAYAELRDALKNESGLNTVLTLDLDGDGTETVIVRAVQRDPIKRMVTHADFLRVDPNVPIKVKVPITIRGEATAVLNAGGMIEQNMFELEVEVSPMNIPDAVYADVSEMSLDSRVAVRDVDLPDGVTTALAPEIAVVSPIISRAVKMAANESDEDGDDAAADADGDGGGDGGGDE